MIRPSIVPKCIDIQADADPDPDLTPDPDPNPFSRERNCVLQIFNNCVQSLPNLSVVIFSARMREEG